MHYVHIKIKNTVIKGLNMRFQQQQQQQFNILMMAQFVALLHIKQW